MRSLKDMLRWALVATVLVGGLAITSTAFAQQGIIDLEESVIKGRIQKPEAFYILQHANLHYEPFDKKPSFIPQLLKSVKKQPF